MLSKEEKDRVIDYFESWELAEILKTPIDDFVDAFEDEIEDRLDDLNEIMGYEGEDDEEGL